MCALEFPGIETDIWQPYQASGMVSVAGVNSDPMGNDDTATVQAFVDQTQITFPTGLELTASYTAYRGAVESISPYPVDVIVDQDGNIAYMAGEYDPDAMRATLDALLQ